MLHTEILQGYIVDRNQIWIVIKLFRFIWHQMEFRLVLNQSEKFDFNPNLVSVDQVQDRFLCVYVG